MELVSLRGSFSLYCFLDMLPSSLLQSINQEHFDFCCGYVPILGETLILFLVSQDWGSVIFVICVCWVHYNPFLCVVEHTYSPNILSSSCIFFPTLPPPLPPSKMGMKNENDCTWVCGFLVTGCIFIWLLFFTCRALWWKEFC